MIGINEILEQFHDQPHFIALVGSYMEQVEDLQNLVYDMLNKRSLDTATGVTLDNLGTILLQPRNGRTDDEYRAYLKAYSRVNQDEATIEDIIFAMKLIGSTLVEIREQQIAYMIIHSDRTSSDVMSIIKKAKGAGVKVDVIETTDDAFMLSPTNQSIIDSTHGLSDTTQTLGGRLSEYRGRL